MVPYSGVLRAIAVLTLLNISSALTVRPGLPPLPTNIAISCIDTAQAQITLKYRKIGSGILGQPREFEELEPCVAYVQFYDSGAIYYQSGSTEAFSVHHAIFDKYREIAFEIPLGYPTTDEQPASGGGRYNKFEKGAIYWKGNIGAWALSSPIYDQWRDEGLENSHLGYPIFDQREVGQYTGFVPFVPIYFVEFENGVISYDPNPELAYPVRDEYGSGYLSAAQMADAWAQHINDDLLGGLGSVSRINSMATTDYISLMLNEEPIRQYIVNARMQWGTSSQFGSDVIVDLTWTLFVDLDDSDPKNLKTVYQVVDVAGIENAVWPSGLFQSLGAQVTALLDSIKGKWFTFESVPSPITSQSVFTIVKPMANGDLRVFYL